MENIDNGTLPEILLTAMQEDNLCEADPLAYEVEEGTHPYVTNFSTEEILTRLVKERDKAIQQAAVSTKNLYNEATDMSDTIHALMQEAKEYGCGAVQITASDMGVLLYTDFGFVKNGNFMQYKF